MSRPRAAFMAGLGGLGIFIGGLIPVLFMAWARDAGSLGKLSALGLWAMAATVATAAVLGGVVVFRIASAPDAMPPDLWVASFLAFDVWLVGVLTLVPGLVFLRLTDDISLNDFGARFFVEWALIYLVVAGAAFLVGRWSLRSLGGESSMDTLPDRLA